MLMEKDADPIRFCKDPNEMFAFSWGDEVRKNPEKLINYLPNLFPDDPAVKRSNNDMLLVTSFFKFCVQETLSVLKKKRSTLRTATSISRSLWKKISKKMDS